MSKSQATTSAFSPTTMLALVLVSFVCVTGLILVSSFEPELKSGNDGAAHALSKSSVGYSGMVSLTRGLNYDVVVERTTVDKDGEVATSILTPPATINEDAIVDYESSGPIVLILPKWQAERDSARPSWAKLVGVLDLQFLRDMIPSAWQGPTFEFNEQNEVQTIAFTYQGVGQTKSVNLGTSLPIKNIHTIKGRDWINVLPGPNGTALIAKHVDRDLYLVSDPDLFNNAGLASLNHARLLDHFLTDIGVEDKRLVFDLTLNGFQRQRNLTRLALEPPLLGVTLCLLLAGVLIGFQAATRFLPPKAQARALSLGKSALADNTAALIRMGKRETRMAVPYSDLIRRQVMKTIGIAPTADKDTLYRTLDRATALTKSKARYSELMSRAEAVKTKQDLIKVAESLHKWKQEMTRERQ